MEMRLNSAQSTTKTMAPVLYLLTMYSTIHTFGFPGEYITVVPMLEMVVKYTVFLSQVAVIFLSSGNTIFDIKLINIQFRYWPVYFFLGEIIAVSLLVSSYLTTQISYCLSLAINVIFYLWVCENFTVEKMLEMVYQTQVVFIALNIIYPLLFPGYYNARNPNVFFGCLGVKNVAASEFSFGLLMQCLLLLVKMNHHRSIRRPKFFFGFMGLQFFLLIITEGKGALLTALSCVFYLAFIDRKKIILKHRLHLGYLYIVLSIGFLFFALTLSDLFTPVFESLGKDPTFTGRTITWNKLIDVMQQSHTMTGYGYNMFWSDEEAMMRFHRGFSYKDSWHAKMHSGAHNNMLELWGNIGLIGIVCYFFTLLVTMRKPNRWNQDQYIFIAGFMLLLMIYGFTENSFTTYGHNTVFLFLAMGYACKSGEEEKNALFRTEE